MSTQTQVGRLWVQNTTVDNLDERELINDFTVTFNGTPVDNNNFVKLDKNTVLYTGSTIASSTVVITKVVGFTSVAVNQYYQRVVEALRLLTEGDVVIPDGSIVNADISPTAGIEQVKLALSERLTSLQGLTTAGLVQLAAGPDSEASIATPLQIRSAASITSLATKNPKALWFSNNAFAKNNDNSVGTLSGGLDIFVDRLLNITQRATVSVSPSADVSGIFGAIPTYAFLSGSAATTIEIDFTNGGGPGTYGLTYPRGTMVFTFYDAGWAGFLTPLSVQVEMLSRHSGDTAGTWVTLGTLYPEDNSLAAIDKPLLLDTLGPDFVAKIRVTFTPRPGAGQTVPNSIRWYAALPGESELPQFLLCSAQAQQLVYGPGLKLLSAGGASATIIAPGTIQINTGATLTAMLRATKTIAGTNPETITVTGAVVGDIVELSKPVNGEVTAPNTVTFNGTGLSGTLVAIVKRYT